jgi:type I restriction enzyme R subunit
MKFNEDSRVKIPTILHLMRLGYNYLSLKDPRVTWDESTNIFTDIFLQSIKRINPSLNDLEAKQYLADVSLTLENEDLGKAFYETPSMLSLSYPIKKTMMNSDQILLYWLMGCR